MQDLVAQAISEDLGTDGDLTSALLLQGNEAGTATIFAKQEGVLAGILVAKNVFTSVDSDLKVELTAADGSRVQQGQRVLSVHGSLHSLLTAERTALNFLQRLSGIATLTARFVEQVQGTAVRILDTRKTTPLLRKLEKHAVKMGGGMNHRFGLYDMILIKENHITATGSISAAVSKAQKGLRLRGQRLPIEVEVRNLTECAEAAVLQVDRIMLDNMPVTEVRKAVDLIDGRAEIEVSGGISLDSVRELAHTGINYISVGALTHSAPALDLSMLIE